MSESGTKVAVVLVCIALVLSTLAVFWQVHSFGFVNYDDDDYVYENPGVTQGLTWDSFVAAFTTPHVGNWLPMVWLSFALDYQLFGPDPGWMHLVNVALHIANAVLLFLILRKATGGLWPSAFVAAAFALHPMHVESVAWITERKDVLSGFFLLLTVAAYARYVRRHSVISYVLAVLLYALGLLAKPMIVTVPLLLLLLDYWPLNRFELQPRESAGVHSRLLILRRMIAEKIPFFVLSAIWSVVTFLVQRGSGSVADLENLPAYARCANAFQSYAQYVAKMFWPRNMAVFYPYDEGTVRPLQAILSALLIITVSILAIRSRRKHKYLYVGWLWFLAALVPVIGLIQSGAQSMADRYTYIPYIGLFIMIAWGVPELMSGLPHTKHLLGGAAAIVFAALGVCAYRQTSYWTDSITLFSHAIEVTQRNDTAYNNRGSAYTELGLWEKGIEDFHRAIGIRPDNAHAYNNLGVAYVKLGRWQEAEKAFKLATEAEADYAEACNNLGIAYGERGRWQEAEEAFMHALDARANYAEAYNNLGIARSKLERWQEAEEAYKRAIEIDRNYVAALNNLGEAYEKLGKWQAAIESYKEAIAIKPDHAESHKDLGSALGRLGRWEEATIAYERAVESEPNYVEAYKGLGIAYGKVGRWQDATQSLEQAIALDPNDAATHHNIGIAYVELGRRSAGIEAFRRAIAHDPNSVDSHHNLANELVLEGRYDEALNEYRAALRLKPEWPVCMNNLAFLIAAYPELSPRDANEAIHLAERACELTGYKDPSYLDTLAVAYASAGRFGEAVDTARRALGLADAAGQTQLGDVIRSHLSLYTQGKPWVEPLHALSDPNGT